MTKIEMFLDKLSQYDDFVEGRRKEIESLKEKDDFDNLLSSYASGLSDAIVKVWEMAFECGFARKEGVE